MKVVHIIFSLIFFSSVLIAQTRKIDSLTHLLNNHPSEDQVELKLQLAEEYLRVDHNKSLELGKECRILAQESGNKLQLIKALLIESGVMMQIGYLDSASIHLLPKVKEYSVEIGYKKGLAQYYNITGGIFSYRGQYDSALLYYDLAIKEFTQLNDSISLAKCNVNLLTIYTNKGEYEKALDCGLRAKEILERTGNPGYKAVIYNNIAANYHSWGNTDKALEYYNLAIENIQKTGNDFQLSAAFSNIGEIFKDRKQYSTAIEYYQKARSIIDKFDDIYAKAVIYLSMGETYNLMEDFNAGINLSNRALKLFQTMNHLEGIARSYACIGKSFQGAGDYHKAIESILKSNKIALQVGLPDLLLANYQNLTSFYKAIQQPEKALENLQLYSQLKDSIYTKEKAKLFTELETKYETQKKEQQIQLQETMLEKKALQQHYLIAFLIAGLIALVLIIWAYLKIRKTNFQVTNQSKLLSEKNELLELQNEEIRTQAESLEQANHEITLQKNVIQKSHTQLTDSLQYAKLIQTRMLPTREFIDSIFPENLVVFKPLNIVSGDFFFLKQKLEYTYLSSADCTGHGVPGALMSMLGMALLNEIVGYKNIVHASRILDELRVQLKRSLHQTRDAREQKEGMDIALCIINNQTLEMSYAAAHIPLWIMRRSGNSEGKLIELSADNQPLGISHREYPFTEQKFKLEKGDILYLFTDGFHTQFDSTKLKKFQFSQLRDLISGIHHLPLREQELHLEQSFEKWKGSADQTDDMLAFAIKI